MSESPTRCLGRLVERISALADASGSWTLSTDELMEILDVPPVEFWRALHAVRDKVDFGGAVDGFCHETVGDLVTLLEILAGPEVEGALTAAGVFIPHELRVELMDSLLHEGRRLAAMHEIDAEGLASMLRFAGSPRRAIAIYFDAHTDVDALIRACAEAFSLGRGMPDLGRATACRYLQSLFARHVLDRAAVLASLAERLRFVAAQLGYVDPEETRDEDGRAWQDGDQGDDAAGSAFGRESARRAWARRIMGILDERISAEELRARYRELVMRYHPDANPAGLERCKDINAAYSILISANGSFG